MTPSTSFALAGLAAAGLASTAFTADASALQCAPNQPCHQAQPPSDGRHDFDFLVGDWLIDNQRLKQRFVGSTEWESFSATQTNWPLPAGIGNYDNFIAADWKPGFVGMTLRVFNPLTQLWSIYWLDNQTGGLNPLGVLNPPVVGKFDGNTGVFTGDDFIEGRAVKVRYIWTKISNNQAHWQQAMSTDNGNHWEVNWTMAMTRVPVAATAK